MKKILVSSFVGFFLAVLMNTAGSVEIVKPTAIDEIVKASATSPLKGYLQNDSRYS